MYTKLFFIPLLSIAFLVGCSPKTEKTEQKTAENAEAAPKTDTSKGDIVASLQGKWQSLDDSKNIIEIKGNDFITIYDGKEVSKESLEVSAETDKDCAAASSVDLKGQKIFMTKGQFDASCFSLIRVDAQSLEYSMVGGTGNTLKFKKI